MFRFNLAHALLLQSPTTKAVVAVAIGTAAAAGHPNFWPGRVRECVFMCDPKWIFASDHTC